jgi:hypothetical protein
VRRQVLAQNHGVEFANHGRSSACRLDGSEESQPKFVWFKPPRSGVMMIGEYQMDPET